MQVHLCPRCGYESEARFYGPCRGCRNELRENAEEKGQELIRNFWLGVQMALAIEEDQAGKAKGAR